MTDKKTPAFPIHWENHAEGMTLRDYFAAKAMQSNLTVIREFPDEHWRMGLALDAYDMADAMMKAREA